MNGTVVLIGRLISFSPPYLAFLILFGMIPVFAVVDLIGVKWHSGITVVFYGAALCWTLLLTWNRRQHLSSLNVLDLLLVLFVLVILVSIVLHGKVADLVTGYPRYLPFFLVAPYLCGRLMTQRDIELFVRILVYAGLAILPALLWEAYTSPVHAGRQTFFGMSHTPLLVGGLLAFSLLAVGAQGNTEQCVRQQPCKQTLQYAWMSVIAGFLVWVSARGWVIAAAFGFSVLLSASLWNVELGKTYFRRFLFVIASMWLTFLILPHIDDFYAQLGFGGSTRFTEHSEHGPILGLSSCHPIMAGTDSVTIRWVLYHEAVAQFLRAPLMGTGAGLFGERSCLGAGGFPHSTVLQSFSELGVVGGVIFLALLATATINLFRLTAWEKDLAGKANLLLVQAFLVTYLIADQIYGNYFMASGTYFTLGVITALQGRTCQLSKG